MGKDGLLQLIQILLKLKSFDSAHLFEQLFAQIMGAALAIVVHPKTSKYFVKFTTLTLCCTRLTT